MSENLEQVNNSPDTSAIDVAEVSGELLTCSKFSLIS